MGVGCLGVGCLGVGSRGRVTPGSAGEKGVGSLPGRRFRAALAGPPPLDVAAAPPRRRRPPLAAAAPETEPTREPSRPPPPKPPPRRQRGPDSACILTLPRSGRNFFRRWMFVFRRWVLNIRRWVTNPTLGVGWHGPCVGRWMRWMPLARALGDGEGRRRGQRAGTTVPLSLGIGRVP